MPVQTSLAANRKEIDSFETTSPFTATQVMEGAIKHMIIRSVMKNNHPRSLEIDAGTCICR